MWRIYYGVEEINIFVTNKQLGKENGDNTRIRLYLSNEDSIECMIKKAIVYME